MAKILDVSQERSRIEQRRELVGQEHPAAARGSSWALALSGGGIRSATFSLGAMQAMAVAPVGRGDSMGASRGLLAHFDYLSTVSGGGYIGSFFCSLFVPGRLEGSPHSPTPDLAQLRAGASRAYEAIAYEPPGRYRSTEPYEGSPAGKFATAWLRENGRYLTPTGNGDLFYAAALAVRNWFSLHYVIGTVLLAAFMAMLLGRACLAAVWPDYALLEQNLLGSALAASTGSPLAIWASPLFAWAGVALGLVVVIGIAFWLAHPRMGEDITTPVARFTLAALAALGIGLTLVAIGLSVRKSAAWMDVGAMLTGLGGLALGGLALHAGSRRSRGEMRTTVAMQRTRMTRFITNAMGATLAVAAIACVETLGQSLYLLLVQPQGWKAASPAAVLPALAWAIQRAVGWMQESREKPPAIPPTAIATAAGLLLLTLVLLFWHIVAQWLAWHAASPSPGAFSDRSLLEVAGAGAGLTLLLAIVTGKFANFINVSSLQSFYGARLTRAYLGASNGARFRDGARATTVAEPHPADELTHAKYYGPDVMAPLHIINVTVNQTVDPGEQLVQRDRKGRPLAVLPHGFTVDGQLNDMPANKRFEIQQPLTIGRWIGLSGAAFSTGLGRNTTLGTSLALGLANVRLGAWWESGAHRTKPLRQAGLQDVLRWMFTSQAYLYCEMTARFHGMRRKWQYLSDGGHFENTALYELLRPERPIEFIVACDNGCDPEYGFADLANLVRLARIDYRAEVEVDSTIACTGRLQTVFGTPGEFAPGKAASGKCAMLLTVRYEQRLRPGHAADRVIVLLKPRVVEGVPVDVLEYSRTHARFPQESTSDQFFDEAQWEAYRKLGKVIGHRVFGDGGGGPAAGAPDLWAYLEKAYGIAVAAPGAPVTARASPAPAAD